MTRVVWCTAILVALGLGSCDGNSTDSPQSSRPQPEPAPLPILFHSDPGGADDLYLMSADGKEVRRLTQGLEAGAFGVWSPDGSRIAFEGRIGGNHIYLVDAKGGEATQITSGPRDDFEPSWSPDGQTIAFTSVIGDNSRIDVVNRDGNERTQLGDGGGPEWSPTGNEIAFISDEKDNLDIYLMASDGSQQRRLTTNAADEYGPTWSPDGKHLAFFSERDGDSELFVMNADGTRQRQISDNKVVDDGAVWSPDGTHIAFVSYRDGADPFTLGEGNAEVYVAAPDGSFVRNVTSSPTWEGDPAWSPNGSRLLFTRRDGYASILVTNLHGDETALRGVAAASNDCCSAWAP